MSGVIGMLKVYQPRRPGKMVSLFYLYRNLEPILEGVSS